MTKEQAVALINAINATQMFLPPMNFNVLAQCDVAKMAVAVLNGEVVCELKPAERPKPKIVEATAGETNAAS